MRRIGNKSHVHTDRCVAGSNFSNYFFRSIVVMSNLRKSNIFPLFLPQAAHCENDRESGNPIVAKMGVIYIHDNGSNVQIINVASITSHPLYKSSEKYYDIALIKLASFIRFDEHVRPACLATRSEPFQKMIAIGFGKTQYG